MGCQSGYKFPAAGLGFPDFDDVFVRKEFFSEGGLWSWGGMNDALSSVYGIMGDNANIPRSSPVQTVSGGTNWKQVSAGFYNIAAIKTDGTLWLWGVNNAGRLGQNLGNANVGSSGINRSSPVQTISGGTNWKQVSFGGAAGAIKTDGTLWMWGPNSSGNLGTNDIINRSSPVQTVSAGTNWKEVYVATGEYTSAIKTDGTLWLWGDNQCGVLGNNSLLDASSPVQTVSGGTNWKQVGPGFFHNAAIKTDGTLWVWGENSDGRLGDGTTIGKSSPVQTVSGGTNWKQVASGGNFSAAIKTDGTLWMFGNNNCGQQGNNSGVLNSSPIQTVSGGTNWKQVSVGREHVAAIKTDSTLWVWGDNSRGGLGTNDLINRSSPVQTISGGTYWKQVSSNWYFNTTIREDCW